MARGSERARAEGWEAPALTSLSRAPIPWSEAELYAYLRTGESRFHGVAAGPMAPVVTQLKALPDQEIRAMAVMMSVDLSITITAAVPSADLSSRQPSKSISR